MKRALQILLIIFAVLAIGAQALRPPKTNPATDPKRALAAHAEVPPEVAAILKRSCSDCHSNQTRWPWYSNVAPTMWLVRNDVMHARKTMNFDEWDRYTSRRADSLLSNVCDQVTARRMPLGVYLPMHSDAKLSDADIQTVCQWTDRERARLNKANSPAAGK